MKRLATGSQTLPALLLPVLLLIAGCSGGGDTPDSSPGTGASAVMDAEGGGPYDTSLPIAEFMPHAFQHTAASMWKWQGSYTDATGEHSLFPKNDEEWTEAESAAMALSELSNILLLPGRKVDSGKWQQQAIAVRTVARQAAEAAAKHDKETFFALGTKLDAECEACHLAYVPRMRPPPVTATSTPPPGP